MLLTQPCKQ